MRGVPSDSQAEASSPATQVTPVPAAVHRTRPSPGRILLSSLATVACLTTAPVSQAANGTRAAPIYTGSFIVQWRDEANANTDADADAIANTARRAASNVATTATSGDGRLRQVQDATGIVLTVKRPMAGNSQLVAVADADATDPEATAARLRKDPRIADVTPDRWLRLHDTVPNDPEYGPRQPYLGSPAAVPGAVNLPLAWDRTQGSEGIVIAVVDTGILPHPDLAGRLLAGYDFIADPTFSLDGDGRDPDPVDSGDNVPAGYVCPGSSSGPPATTGNTWHGTRVAGVIGAASNNAQDVAGVDWRARLLPVRVSGRCGALLSDTVDGMRWAGGLPVPNVPANPNPARVINVSLGGGSCTSAEQSAVNDLIARGAVVVAATGNTAGAVEAPADCAGVIAVTAHANDGENSSFANVGPQVAISAPGGGCGNSKVTSGQCQGPVSLIRTLNNDGTTSPGNYTLSNSAGTSFAAPMVSGVVGLMFAINPNLVPAQVTTQLKNSARAHPAGTYCTQSGNAGACGAGLLDAEGAVAAAAGAPAITGGDNAGDGEDDGGGGGDIGLAGGAGLLLAGLIGAIRRRGPRGKPGAGVS